MRLFFLTIFMLIGFSCFSQREAAVWHFGRFCSIDFNRGYPVVLDDSKLTTKEGCATICDSAGELLFYTDGQNVWNRNNQLMPNGTGLNGDWSSTQSALIVPEPNSDQRFYVFTTDSINMNGKLHYSIVDMNIGENGDVSAKNNELLEKASEKLTACYHKNMTDVWVVTQQLNSDRIYCYLVTGNGVGNPVENTIGRGVFTSEDKIHGTGSNGYMKFSPDGKTLASAVRITNELVKKTGIELFNFDTETGLLSNAKFIRTDLDFGYANIYGVSFSPSGRFLYASLGKKIVQYDLAFSSEADIVASATEIGENEKSFASMQLALDGRIYATRIERDYLRIISSPNKKGLECDFDSDSLFVGEHATIMLGLPNFIQNYFNEPKFIFSDFCPNREMQFTSKIETATRWEWKFGDPESGEKNTSTEENPTHTFVEVGSYEVTLQAYENGLPLEPETQVVKIYQPPVFSLGEDKAICAGESISDVQNLGAGRYEFWFGFDDGARVLNLEENEPFYYTYGYIGHNWLEITPTNGCPGRDTVTITQLQPPSFELGNPRELCYNETLPVSIRNAAETYTWHDGTESENYNVTQSGMHTLTGENRCGTFTDEVYIEVEYCGEVKIPNIVVKGSATNNAFKISNWEGTVWNLQVWDRWGVKVYSNSNFRNNWSDFNLSEGVYYYILSNAHDELHKGFFHVF